MSKMNKTAIFVVNEKLGWTGHLFAYYEVIAKVNVALKKIQELEKIIK